MGVSQLLQFTERQRLQPPAGSTATPFRDDQPALLEQCQVILDFPLGSLMTQPLPQFTQRNASGACFYQCQHSALSVSQVMLSQ